jgi:histone H3/H4
MARTKCVGGVCALPKAPKAKAEKKPKKEGCKEVKEARKGRRTTSEYAPKFIIARAHFRRVAHAICDEKRISGKALVALQRYVEHVMTLQLEKARRITEKVDGKTAKRVLMKRHLKLVDECDSLMAPVNLS